MLPLGDKHGGCGNGTFFHGSMSFLPVGTLLVPRGAAYESDWICTDFYSVLEANRPPEKRAHRDAVFLCKNDEDVGNAGGGEIWMFQVRPITPVEWHDMQFSSLISCLISDGHAVNSPQVVQAAKDYWLGVESADEPLWEGLCGGATIVAVDEY